MDSTGIFCSWPCVMCSGSIAHRKPGLVIASGTWEACTCGISPGMRQYRPGSRMTIVFFVGPLRHDSSHWLLMPWFLRFLCFHQHSRGLGYICFGRHGAMRKPSIGCDARWIESPSQFRTTLLGLLVSPRSTLAPWPRRCATILRAAGTRSEYTSGGTPVQTDNVEEYLDLPPTATGAVHTLRIYIDVLDQGSS